MNVFVTGGTGFIGRHLIAKLMERGDSVSCLVRDVAKAQQALQSFSVEFLQGDISKSKTLEYLKEKKFDLVFHCAAYVSFYGRKKLFKANVEGTRNICELASGWQIKQMVYLSSIAVIVGNDRSPFIEELPYAPTNPYGESKTEAEKVVHGFRMMGLPVSILRPPVVYGSGETHFMKPLLFLLRHGMAPLFSEGKSRLHLVYVENLVDAMLASLKDEQFLKGTYFIADKEALTVREIFSILAKAIRVKEPRPIPAALSAFLLKLPFVSPRFKKFFRDQVYSLKKIEDLHFHPSFDVRASLERTATAFTTLQSFLFFAAGAV